MRLLLIGPPGSGKGTQAVRIAEHFGIEHISSGDLLRRHVAEETAIGRTIKEYVQRGDLVPDGIVMDVLRKPVSAASQANGYVLDGFPRTVEQAEAAYLVAKALGASVRIALYLDVGRDELIRRVLAARGEARHLQVRDVDAGDQEHDETAPSRISSSGRTVSVPCCCKPTVRASVRTFGANTPAGVSAPTGEIADSFTSAVNSACARSCVTPDFMRPNRKRDELLLVSAGLR